MNTIHRNVAVDVVPHVEGVAVRRDEGVEVLEHSRFRLHDVLVAFRRYGAVGREPVEIVHVWHHVHANVNVEPELGLRIRQEPLEVVRPQDENIRERGEEKRRREKR